MKPAPGDQESDNENCLLLLANLIPFLKFITFQFDRVVMDNFCPCLIKTLLQNNKEHFLILKRQKKSSVRLYSEEIKTINYCKARIFSRKISNIRTFFSQNLLFANSVIIY